MHHIGIMRILHFRFFLIHILDLSKCKQKSSEGEVMQATIEHLPNAVESANRDVSCAVLARFQRNIPLLCICTNELKTTIGILIATFLTRLLVLSVESRACERLARVSGDEADQIASAHQRAQVLAIG